MADTLSVGRKVRILNVMDDYNREALAVDPALDNPARKFVETLEQFEEGIGLPQTIRCYNGPEFLSKTFTGWCMALTYELPLKNRHSPVTSKNTKPSISND